MSRMTLSQLATEIKRWLPDKSTDAISGAANFAIREIGKAGAIPQNFRSTLTTTAPVDITAVSATKGSTSITGTGLVAGMLNQFIRISGDDTWYLLSAVGTGTGTLSSAFAGTTGSGTLTATVAYPRVTLPANLLTIDKIGEQNRQPLSYIDAELSSGVYTTGRPEMFTEIIPVNISEYLELALLPFPDASYSFIVEGRKRLTAFSEAGSYSGVPEEHEDILIAGTLFYLWSAEDGEDRAAFWKGMFERGLKRARASRGPVLNRLGRLGAGYAGFSVTHPNEVEYSS